MKNQNRKTISFILTAPLRTLFAGVRHGSEGIQHDYTSFTQMRLWHSEQIKYCFLLSFILLIFNSSLLVFIFRFLPPQIPFFYTKLGSERLAESNLLYLLPSSTAFVFLLNLILARLFFLKESLLSQIIAFITLVVSVMSFSALLNIVLLVLP